jgi:RimJ/RimL family protein N-acetyltransferase
MKPRIFCKYEIKTKHESIGIIKLVKYHKSSLPHIEFSVDDDFQNMGVMSQELPKYLKKINQQGIFRAMAIVEKDNKASMRVLEKSGFIKFADLTETFAYIIAMDIVNEVQKFHKEVLKNIKK